MAVFLLIFALGLGAADRADPIREAYPTPPRVEHGRFFSTSLNREMPYLIYLPPGYEKGSKRYPVLYMLHGMGGSNDEWRDFGLLDAADRLIESKAMPPMLIVLPQGDQAYWLDHASGSKWGQYAGQDVVAEIDRRWRTIPRREARAIGGNSMGAHGALQLALRYPDTFSVVGAHSLTLRGWNETREWFPSGFFIDERYFREHDPLGLAEDRPEAARRLRVWLDVGEEDLTWRPRVTAYSRVLDLAGARTELHVLPGAHHEYWRRHVATYLGFYGRALAEGAAVSG